MNLRILKKLSKRAAPLLAALGDGREQFPAERWEDYTSSCGHDRKHWEQRRVRYPMERAGDIYRKPRNGEGMIRLSEQHIRPWPGTIMLGWSVGYETPEREEDDAWTLLVREVRDHFTEMVEVEADDDDPDWFGPDHMPRLTCSFPNPSAILRVVPELIEARRKEQEERQARRIVPLRSKEVA